MPTTSHNQPSLAALYQGELRPILDELEQRRLRARKRALLSAAIIVPIAIVLALVLVRVIGPFGLIIPLAIGFIGWGFLVHGAMQEYRSYFKSQVIARLAKVIDPDLSYMPGGGISEREFSDSEIYRHRIDRYRAEDRFSGRVGATAFHFSEVHAEYKTTTTDSKGNRRTTWHTIFRGIFFIADFNKDFQGQTFVLPDTAERALGGLGRMMQGWGSKIDGRPGEMVRLEDPEFERLFAVQSTDQVEARYILSPSLMERLTRFRNEIDAPVAIAFVNAQIYIAISTNKNYFEPPALWRSGAALGQGDIEAYFKDVRLAEEIVEDLNLNLRIWSKQ
ncbi:DUF3137 domain-containing protein [Chloroflexales bacterium ZM16-3]|nr:DUF3137 domain-containing protein [Chloroflexales bacterium ZM16-3]